MKKIAVYILPLLLFILSVAKVSAQEAEDTFALPLEPKVEEPKSEPYHGYDAGPFNSKTGDTLDFIHLREISESSINTLKKEDAFWYADSSFNDKEKEFEKESGGSGKGSSGKSKSNSSSSARYREVNYGHTTWLTMPVLVVILCLFIGGLAFYLIHSNIVGRRKVAAENTDVVEDDMENIFEIPYQKEIDKAVKEKNYRLATRLMFLRLLRNLSDRNIITYKQDRTNFDYLSELYNTAYYKDFFRLTRSFEYAWYGWFEITEENFNVIRRDFENFDRRLS